MLTPVVQRWSAGRDSYRPAGEPIDTSAFDVVELEDDRTARDFVVANHYSRSYPAARFRFGLYRGADLVGVAVFSVPVNDAALNVLPGRGLERVELGRFVLVDDVPANGESWFLARAFELLRSEGIAGVVSFSDPIARTSVAGDVVFPGHVGTIYQATNAVYLGRATPRTLRILPDGTVLNARSLQKLRAGERGWRYVVEQLVRHGAQDLDVDGDRRAWSQLWVEQLTRPLRHRGNHRYAWALRRRDRRHLPESLPYPKFQRAAA